MSSATNDTLSATTLDPARVGEKLMRVARALLRMTRFG